MPTRAGSTTPTATRCWQPTASVLATRVLQHPHVTEQPVTRELDGVRIPAGLAQVRVRAHDLVHGYGGAEATVEIPD